MPSATHASPVIVVDTSALTLVRCPRCQKPLGQDNMVPGHQHQYRCARCDSWVVVVVAMAYVPAEDPWAAESTPVPMLPGEDKEHPTAAAEEGTHGWGTNALD